MDESPGIRWLIPLAMLAMGSFGTMQAVFASPPAHRPLDLQLPANMPLTVDKSSAPFPSMHRPAQWAEGPSQPRGWSAAVSSARTPSRVEELTLRFHREGLPLARLWENKSALVSLGLNPKGKLGVWLTQKTH
jgi:hypothetical protein